MFQNCRLFGYTFGRVRPTKGCLRSLLQLKDWGVFSVREFRRAEGRMFLPVLPLPLYKAAGKVVRGSRRKRCAGDTDSCWMLAVPQKIIFESLTKIMGGGCKSPENQSDIYSSDEFPILLSKPLCKPERVCKGAFCLSPNQNLLRSNLKFNL
jgi:hypothetical protein